MGGGYAKSQSPCAGTSVTQTFCTSNVTITSPSDPNYEYDWYTYTSCQGLTGMAYTETINNLNATLNDGEHCFRYEAVNKNITPRPSPTCSTEVLVKVFTGQIEASSTTLNTTSTLSIVYQGNSTFPNILSYQWYRNGCKIIGATQPVYTVTRPGDYYLQTLSGSCGTLNSNTIIFDCPTNNSTNYNDYTFLAGTYNLSGDIYIQGYIKIDPNAEVFINNARIFLDDCAEIIISKAVQNNDNGGILTISNTILSSCGIWQGIKLYGTTTPNDPKSGILNINNTEIHDALVGIFVNNDAFLYGNQCLFENNLMHMQLGNCQETQGYMNNSRFSFVMTEPLSQICNGLPARTLGLFPYVHYDYSSMFTFENDTFNCYNTNGMHSEIGFDINLIQTTNPVQTDSFGVRISDCQFLGDFNYAIYGENAQYTHINGTGNSKIVGNFKQAIHIFNTSNHINIDKQLIQNTSNTKHAGGIYIQKAEDILITNNTLENLERGIEYYREFAPSFSHPSFIYHNIFNECTFGVSIASHGFPVGTNAGNNLSYTKDMHLNCNKFHNNDWGMIGVGPIVDQYTWDIILSNKKDWDCFFSSGMATDHSYKADVAWFDYDTVLNAKRDFEIYYNSTFPLYFSSSYAIDLYGVSISSSNIVNYIKRTPSSNISGCRGSFKTDPNITFFTNSDTHIAELKISPNPFNQNLKLFNPLNGATKYIIYNNIGKIANQGIIYANQELIFETSEWVSGCYFLKLIDPQSEKCFQDSKLIKIGQ